MDIEPESPAHDGDADVPERPNSARAASADATRQGRPAHRRRALAAIGLIIALAVAGAGIAAAVLSGGRDTSPNREAGIAESADASATPTPSRDELIAAGVEEDASPEVCDDMSSILNDAISVARQRRTQALNVAGLRASARFVGLHPSAISEPHLRRSLDRTISATTIGKAEAATGSATPGARMAYREALLGRCELTAAAQSAIAITDAADDAINRLRSRAERAPWWPRDYTKLSDDIAWQSFTTAEYAAWPCDLTSCLKARVLTRIRCDSVYLEVNVYDDADQAVDWSNDTTGVVEASQPALVEFFSFADPPLKWKVTQVSCS